MIKHIYLKKDPQTAKGVHSIKTVPNPQAFHFTDEGISSWHLILNEVKTNIILLI